MRMQVPQEGMIIDWAVREGAVPRMKEGTMKERKYRRYEGNISITVLTRLIIDTWIEAEGLHSIQCK